MAWATFRRWPGLSAHHSQTPFSKGDFFVILASSGACSKSSTNQWEVRLFEKQKHPKKQCCTIRFQSIIRRMLWTQGPFDLRLVRIHGP